MRRILTLSGLPGKEVKDILSSPPLHHLPIFPGHPGDQGTTTLLLDYSTKIHKAWPAYRSSPELPHQSTVVQPYPLPAGRYH